MLPPPIEPMITSDRPGTSSHTLVAEAKFTVVRVVTLLSMVGRPLPGAISLSPAEASRVTVSERTSTRISADSVSREFAQNCVPQHFVSSSSRPPRHLASIRWPWALSP